MSGSRLAMAHPIRWAILLAATASAFSCAAREEIAWMGFSSSDRYLACAARDGRLTIYDLEKGKSREITTNAAVDGGLEWAPVGDRLAFCLRQKGRWDLALADPAGTVTLLTNDEWRDLQPTWSLDGSGLYYVSSFGGGYARDYDIRYYRLNARQSYPVIRAPHDQVDPRLSPDGRWLAAVSYQHGNPVLLIYNPKTTRAIQIGPPPGFRGDRLRLLLWLGDSRKLLYEVQQGERYYLMECEVESEKSQELETSKEPFESVMLDREKRAVLYVNGGKVYRRSMRPRWGGKQRLTFDNLAVNYLAPRHRDDRVGAVVEGRLLALASAKGDKVEPLRGDAETLLDWGDLALRRGRGKQGLVHYDAAFRHMREAGKADAEGEIARVKLERVPVLLGLGFWRETSDYLRDVQRLLGQKVEQETRSRLNLLLALNEYVWKDRQAAARALLEQTPLTKPSSDSSSAVALLLKILSHPDKQVRQEIRRALGALWRGKTDEWAGILERLLKTHRADPVVQAVYCAPWSDAGDLMLLGEITFLPTDESATTKFVTTLARMIVRYPEIVGVHFKMDQKWFDSLWEAYAILRDANGLKRLIRRDGPQFLGDEKIVACYHRYWNLRALGEEDDRAVDETLAEVLFDREILALVGKRVADPRQQTDVRLARARRALVVGDWDEMQNVLGELGKALDQAGAERLFDPEGLGKATYTILQGERDERLADWGKAVARYRQAAREIEEVTKTKKTRAEDADRLPELLNEARFRADLLERGAAVKSELTELLSVERSVGDHLMMDSSDPTSLLNGIRNYFALLGRVGTPWVKDLVFLKAGQCYRRLGRWCEAGFCLRVAAQSRERFVAQYARGQMSEFYRDLEDPGLARF